MIPTGFAKLHQPHAVWVQCSLWFCIFTASCALHNPAVMQGCLVGAVGPLFGTLNFFLVSFREPVSEVGTTPKKGFVPAVAPNFENLE